MNISDLRPGLIGLIAGLAIGLVFFVIQLRPIESAGSSMGYAGAYTAALAALQPGEQVMTTAATGSMLPTMSERSVVVVEPVKFAEVKVGDIVVFTQGGSLVCHRVLHVRGSHLITRGDNNFNANPPVFPEALQGRVRAVFFYR